MVFVGRFSRKRTSRIDLRRKPNMLFVLVFACQAARTRIEVAPPLVAAKLRLSDLEVTKSKTPQTHKEVVQKVVDSSERLIRKIRLRFAETGTLRTEALDKRELITPTSAARPFAAPPTIESTWPKVWEHVITCTAGYRVGCGVSCSTAP